MSLNYTLYIKAKNEEPIRGKMLFDGEHEAREFGLALLNILAEILELRLDLSANDISEIGNSSHIWKEDHGKMVYAQMSNCD